MYPPDFDQNNDFEPVGIRYGRFMEWEKTQTAIDRLCEQTTASQSNNKTEPPPVDPMIEDKSGTSQPFHESPAPGGEAESPLQERSNESDLEGSGADELAGTGVARTVVAPRAGASAATTDDPASTTLAASPTSRWNLALGRSPDFGLPGQRWSRALGGRSTITSACNMFLSETSELTEFQTQKFWELVGSAARVHGLQNTDQTAVKVAEAWQNCHFITIGTNGIGLGGLLHVEHAKRLLKQAGNDMLQSQSGLLSSSYPSNQHCASQQSLLVPRSLPTAPQMFVPTLAPLAAPAGPTTLQPCVPTAPPKRQKVAKTMTIKKGESLAALTVVQLQAALQALNVPAGHPQ